MIRAEKTQYKNIYKKTYWGNCEYDNLGKSHESDNIINNRNVFAKTYKIKNYIFDKPKYISEECDENKYKIDHIEIYTTEDNKYLIVNSPYYVSEKEEQILLNNGWEKIYKLYSTSAVTFIKIIEQKNKKSS